MSTKVIFRKSYSRINKEWEVEAFFPEFPGDMNPYRTCVCYAHLGQHSASSFDYYYSTRPATPEEYKDLYAELVSIGYDDLKIAKRMTRKDLAARKAQTK